MPFRDIEEKYEVLHKLAEGGMGAVFKVRHRLLGEDRVVKVIRPGQADDENLRTRFRREAQAAIHLRHPNIAHVHDFAIDSEGSAYTVMEFIEGMTLKQMLGRGGPPPVGLAIEIAQQALGALGYLHGQGYLHRDISPDNIMVSRAFDGQPLVKLIDLGLAKRLASDLDLTSSGVFVGKIRYASPEQFKRPTSEPDPRSDLYSFALVLYELLTGVCPIDGSSFEEIMTAHLLDTVPEFAQTDPEGRVHKGLRKAVLQALDKNPASRYQDAAEFAQQLRPYAGSTVPTFGELARIYDIPRVRGFDAPSQLSTRALGEATLARPQPEVEGTVRLDAGAAHPLQKPPPKPAQRPSERTQTLQSRRFRPWQLAAGLLLTAAIGWAGFVFWQGSDAIGRATMDSADTRPGTVLVDALPWARITAIIDQEGNALPVANESYTPKLLTLPPGTYRITLENPDLPAPRILTLAVSPGGQTQRTVELGTMSTDSYFAAVGLAEQLEQAGS